MRKRNGTSATRGSAARRARVIGTTLLVSASSAGSALAHEGVHEGDQPAGSVQPPAATAPAVAPVVISPAKKRVTAQQPEGEQPQPAPIPQQPTPPQPVTIQPPAPIQVPPPVPPPVPEPVPVAPQPVVPAKPAAVPQPPPVVKAPQAPVQPAAVVAVAPAQSAASDLTKGLVASAFVDGYFSFNFGTPKPQAGRNRFRAYDNNNGFGIGWVGLNLAYTKGSAGAVIDLRFGPNASRLAGADADFGLEFVKQAYVTWSPTDLITLDFGKFDTIYGAEVADSQGNFNYTRGLVNWLAQPFHHTGVRLTADFVPGKIWGTAMLVNGWDSSVDVNIMKTLGLQVSGAFGKLPTGEPRLTAHLGYLVGPEQEDFGVVPNFCVGGTTFDPRSGNCNTELPASSTTVFRDAGGSNTDGLRHLIDLVVQYNISDTTSLLFNFDYGTERVREGSLSDAELGDFRSERWIGVSLAGRSQLNEQWGVALRGELIDDPEGRFLADDDPFIRAGENIQLYSATATVDHQPLDGLLFRLDVRADFSNGDVFPFGVRSYRSSATTATLGVVVSTD